MTIRKFFYAAAASLPILGAAVVFLLATMPQETAHACLPCDCPTNRSLNCFGPYFVDTIEREAGCFIEILSVNENGADYLAISTSPAELAALPDQLETNVLVDQYYEFALYKLTSGEYQVNVGPNVEGKVYVTNFTGCPATNVRESNFTVTPE